MKLLKIFPKNFINLILGRSVLNIADSFYMVAVTIALVEVYNIEASTLTSFALIGMIPSLVAFSYSYFFNKIKNTKFWILCFQIMHIILVSLLIVALVNKAHIAFIFIYISALFPACAGVIRRSTDPTSLSIAFPRMRGGAPPVPFRRSGSLCFSPHARG